MKKIIISLIAVFTIFGIADAKTRISSEGKRMINYITAARIVLHDIPRTLPRRHWGHNEPGFPKFAAVSLTLAAVNAFDESGVIDAVQDSWKNIKDDYSNYQKALTGENWQSRKYGYVIENGYKTWENVSSWEKFKVGAQHVGRGIANSCYAAFDSCYAVGEKAKYTYYDAKNALNKFITGSADPFDHVL